MKTNFKSQKENKVQETALKSIIAMIIIVAVSIPVNGQIYWLSDENNYEVNAGLTTNSSKNAVQNLNNSENLGANETFARYFEEEADDEIRLEDWMTDATYFGTFVSIEVENDNPLGLENWMTDESFFNGISANTETEAENTLELESWMTDENYFNATFKVAEESDNSLELENWMLNENYFEVTQENDNPLEIENWMVAANYWHN